MKGVSEFSKKSDPKPSDLLSPVVASPVSLKDIISKNQKVESQLNPLSFEVEMQQTAPVPKLYQDTDGQRIQPSGQQSTKLDQSSSKASFNMVSDLSKTGFQKIADVGYSTAFGGRSPADILGQSNHKNLPNSVGTGEQLQGNIGGKSSFLCVSLICFISSICK
uniref:Uncharacterized protein n=1 Tax=Fagus sylvatica TaxID=28930 RepID=A0A2N9F7X5_FAGSY